MKCSYYQNRRVDTFKSLIDWRKAILVSDEEQKNALAQYILEQGLCHGAIFNSGLTSSATEKKPLIEILDDDFYSRKAIYNHISK